MAEPQMIVLPRERVSRDMFGVVDADTGEDRLGLVASGVSY